MKARGFRPVGCTHRTETPQESLWGQTAENPRFSCETRASKPNFFATVSLFSWEWTTIAATFLALALFLSFTHSLRRLAAWRALAMILAGIGVLVVDVVRAQSNFGPVMYTTPYIGFYVIGALAIGLLFLGVIEARVALLATTPKGLPGGQRR